ncbi:hypothetical protein FQZ97_895900 [compost metagenome]
MLLEGFHELDIALVIIDRIHFFPGQQIPSRNDDMDMRLAVFQFTCLAIGDLQDLGDMCFGVEVELVLMIGIHHEAFKFVSNVPQRLLGYFILGKR